MTMPHYQRQGYGRLLIDFSKSSLESHHSRSFSHSLGDPRGSAMVKKKKKACIISLSHYGKIVVEEAQCLVNRY